MTGYSVTFLFLLQICNTWTSLQSAVVELCSVVFTNVIVVMKNTFATINIFGFIVNFQTTSISKINSPDSEMHCVIVTVTC